MWSAELLSPFRRALGPGFLDDSLELVEQTPPPPREQSGLRDAESATSYQSLSLGPLDLDLDEDMVSPARQVENSSSLWRKLAAPLSLQVDQDQGLTSNLPSPTATTRHRLVDRDGDFHQSRGRLSIRKKIKRRDWRALYSVDLFHSLVDLPTFRLLFILLGVYVFWIFFFSLVYLTLSFAFPTCNLGLSTFQQAFYFSLETMATIGYGTRDIFFGDCMLPALVLTCHMCVRLVSDALTVGVIYSRLARPTTRASTVIFSNHAVIRRIRGRLFLMFQLCELRKHQLNEAHVRLYCIRQEREPGEAAGSSFQTCAMRVNRPNDETGAMLLLCLPQVVVHELDACSPLMPPPLWTSQSPQSVHRWQPPVLGSVAGGSTALANGVFPSVGSRGMDLRTSTSAAVEEFVNVQTSGILPASQEDHRVESLEQQQEREMIQTYIRDRRVEIVAVVEGTDAASGGVVQARHSYIVDEIIWHHSHAACVFEDPEEAGFAMIDFSKFHQLLPASVDAAFAGVVSSHV